MTTLPSTSPTEALYEISRCLMAHSLACRDEDIVAKDEIEELEDQVENGIFTHETTLFDILDRIKILESQIAGRSKIVRTLLRCRDVVWMRLVELEIYASMQDPVRGVESLKDLIRTRVTVDDVFLKDWLQEKFYLVGSRCGACAEICYTFPWLEIFVQQEMPEITIIKNGDGIQFGIPVQGKPGSMMDAGRYLGSDGSGKMQSQRIHGHGMSDKGHGKQEDDTDKPEQEIWWGVDI